MNPPPFAARSGRPLGPLPVPEVSTTGELTVWQLVDDDALVKVDVCADTGHAEKVLRRDCKGPAVAEREGTILKVRGGTTERQLSTIRRALAKLRSVEGASPPSEPAAAVAPVKAKLAVEEVSVEIEADDGPLAGDELDEQPATVKSAPPDDSPPCAVGGCEDHARIRRDTPKGTEQLCRHHRDRARDRAKKWNITLAQAAATVVEGLTERPARLSKPKPSQLAKLPQKKPGRPKKAPATAKPAQSADPLNIVRRYAAAVNALGGLEAAEQLATVITRAGGHARAVEMIDAVLTLG